MIKLMVEDYCHNCRDFEVHCKSRVATTPDGDGYYDHILECKNSDKCRMIKKHIERSMKEAAE